MKIFFTATVILLLASCSEAPVDKNQNKDSAATKAQVPPSKTVTIASTGLTLDIPADMDISIAPDTGYVFANISPIDKSQHDILEAALYLGPVPNRDAPEGKHTRTESQGSLLGRTVNWVTYSTTNWQHKEVIIDYETKKKQYLHVWCNGRNEQELNRAMNVIKTLRLEPKDTVK
ncbi:MAG: hypothetical protein MUC87_14560 [Bacteroidia bacterium]|jgi:hypothetical protein|nr:hypothetical protein [Bacteroidia bacterium]